MRTIINIDTSRFFDILDSSRHEAKDVSHLSARVSDKVLRPVLATILVIVGVRMLRT